MGVDVVDAVDTAQAFGGSHMARCADWEEAFDTCARSEVVEARCC